MCVVTWQYKSKTLSPRWLEQFDLYMYDDQTNQLEITVFDHDVSGRDDFMGRYHTTRTCTRDVRPRTTTRYVIIAATAFISCDL